MEEVWKDIPGWEGLYQVSDQGRVKSMNYHRTGKVFMLKPGESHNGYLHVTLWVNGKGISYRINRLVWETFNGPIPEGMHVNHINEDKRDNRLENLNLMTPKDNNNWGTRNEKLSRILTNRKDQSKWVIKLSLNNEILHFYPSFCEAERETGIKRPAISACCRKVASRKTAGGFIWKYVE